VFTQYFRFSAAPRFEARRCALLERLLARAQGQVEAIDWRADGFRVLAPQPATMPAVAAAALCAEGRATDAAWVCIATPVRYLAEPSSVRLPLDGMLSLDPVSAEALALDFNRVWNNSGTRLIVGRAAALYCVFDRALCALTHDPEDALGRHIEDFLPSGSDAPRLRLLMSEIEMWLFEHAVNRARQAQQSAVISGLWLWGGGSPVKSLPAVQGWALGNDPFFSALGAGPTSSDARVGSGVIVASQEPGSDGWQRAGLPWLEAAAAQLRSGRLARLELSAGRRCFTVTTLGMHAFWRRRKPWWESFA
jgi:hypothetical protein